ncbi:hypothetical protein HZH66_003194 [Vespula vulgaris]|uniref:Uncharacterized protein n=1 Tax=Vespula vulgaris TaxID=7454 RepID=A0A834KMJ7_VESVU|nr:hypothetical protein HZH66_003194 [Vespula vulgaris]
MVSVNHNKYQEIDPGIVLNFENKYFSGFSEHFAKLKKNSSIGGGNDHDYDDDCVGNRSSSSSSSSSNSSSSNSSSNGSSSSSKCFYIRDKWTEVHVDSSSDV